MALLATSEKNPVHGTSLANAGQFFADGHVEGNPTIVSACASLLSLLNIESVHKRTIRCRMEMLHCNGIVASAHAISHLQSGGEETNSSLDFDPGSAS